MPTDSIQLATDNAATAVKRIYRDYATKRVWNTATSAFEAYNASNLANYLVSGTEEGATNYWTFTRPAGVTVPFEWTTFDQAGAVILENPACQLVPDSGVPTAAAIHDAIIDGTGRPKVDGMGRVSTWANPR
jgi:hypothetical protein